MTDTYVGGELEIFAHARRWKAYFGKVLAPFGKRVLEVGAGIGATTSALCDGSQEEWICLEPDAGLLAQVEEQIRTGVLPACCRSRCGTVPNLDLADRFDSILYVDVLEHIADDRIELQLAAQHLGSRGRLMVLSPALPSLYSPFDKSIGHYRRYTRASLAAIAPSGCRQVKLLYLDSVGLFTSLANRLLLKQSLPSREQIEFWDRNLVPLSRLLDPLTGFHVGRSIAAIWERVR